MVKHLHTIKQLHLVKHLHTIKQLHLVKIRGESFNKYQTLLDL